MGTLPIIGDADSGGVGGDFANAVVAGIGHVNIAVCVHAQSCRVIELSHGPTPIDVSRDSRAGHGAHPSIRSDFPDSGEVADKNVCVRVHSRILWAFEKRKEPSPVGESNTASCKQLSGAAKGDSQNPGSSRSIEIPGTIDGGSDVGAPSSGGARPSHCEHRSVR